MNLSDREAMNELAEWFNEEDPVLDDTHPDWVWDLVSLVDDLLRETGRL